MSAALATAKRTASKSAMLVPELYRRILRFLLYIFFICISVISQVSGSDRVAFVNESASCFGFVARVFHNHEFVNGGVFRYVHVRNGRSGNVNFSLVVG